MALENFYPAKPDDLMHPSLHDEFTGVFYKVNPTVLEQLAKNCNIQAVNAGRIIYEQDEPSRDMPIYFIIDGSFEAQHTTSNGIEIPIAKGSEMIMFGETEYFLANVPDAVTKYGVKGRRKARIKCIEDGRLLTVWPPQELVANEDYQLLSNLHRISLIKLMRRNHVLELRWMDDDLGCFVNVLRSIVLENSASIITKPTSPVSRSLSLRLDNTPVAKRAGITKSSRTMIKKRIKSVDRYKVDFSGRYHEFIIKGSFLDDIQNSSKVVIEKVRSGFNMRK